MPDPRRGQVIGQKGQSLNGNQKVIPESEMIIFVQVQGR